MITFIFTGEFYSESAKGWISCGSSWDALCAYQSSCFTWSPGEFLNLDTLSWVTEWNSTTQIQITDPQLDNIPLCRSFTYYVDSSSTSTTELGTEDHPYKELSSVFTELFQFHSHSDRLITAKLMEGTTSYLVEGSYVLNMSGFVIESYSKTSPDPRKAKIITVEKSSTNIVTPGMPTHYKILSNSSVN